MGIYRFVLSFVVVISHIGLIFPSIDGIIAVEAFFIISGFYMALAIDKKYIHLQNTYKSFLLSRLFRIYPTYLFILFLNILFALFVFFWTDGRAAAKMQIYLDSYHQGQLSIFHLISILLLNFFFLGWDWLLFIGYSIPQGIYFTLETFDKEHPALFKFLLMPQTWTLSTEFGFYLISPWLVGKKSYKMIIIFFICLSIKLFAHFYLDIRYNSPILRVVFLELAFFCLGGIAYHYFYKGRRVIKKHYSYFLWILLVSFTFFWAWLSVNYTLKAYLYLFFVFLCLPHIFTIFKYQFDEYLQDASYSLYVSHIFTSMILGILGLSPLAQLPFIIFCSFLLYEFVDKYANRYRKKVITKMATKK